MTNDFLTSKFDQRQERRTARVDFADMFAFDKPLAIGVILLALIGMLFIYSASSYSASVQFGDAFHYVKTQAVALFVGLLFMFGLSFVEVDSIKRVAFLLYAVVCPIKPSITETWF